MSGSNPFRRKQQPPHGNEALSAGEDEIARAGARFPALDTGDSSAFQESVSSPDEKLETALVAAKTNTKHVRIVSPHSSKLGSESDDNSHERFPPSPASWESRDDSLPFENKESPSIEDTSPENPFEAGSETDSMGDEEEVASPKRRTARSVPSKARSTLGVDSDNPWRTSTLIGNLPYGSAIADRGVVPAKAQKTLGISQAGGENENEFRQQTSSPQLVPPKAQRTLGIPSNPFQKKAPPINTNYPDDNNDEDERPDTSRNSSVLSNRTPLSHDAFTRLLVTGDVDSSASTPSILPLQGTLGDSSSNTDASSLSRQSIIDSQTGSHIETPRTSHDSSPDEDLQRSLQRTVGKFSSIPDTLSSVRYYAATETQAKSTNPYARDPVASRLYADYSVDSPTISTFQHISPRSSTDLNKPLPPPPTTIISENGAKILGAGLSQNAENSFGPHELPATAARSRIAPDPPLARRHSQLRSKQGSMTSGRSTPITEESMSDIIVSASSSIPSSYKPPAPPPPRRRATDRNPQTLEHPNISELPSTPIKRSLSIQKQPPPLPPARSSSMSKHAAQENLATLGSASMAPPPPPRRRGSSTSSYSLRQPSGEVSQEGDESQKMTAPTPTEVAALQSSADAISKAAAPSMTEIAALQSSAYAISKATAPEPNARSLVALQSSANVISKAAAGNKDVMADLSKLQQEVDALRGRYETRGPGDQGWEF
ncbi:hypothetical protein MMC13_003714 [Lambiella insularis]|nr:hypothetical protein [Lambiella insularis]